jgi:hypothetical protein
VVVILTTNSISEKDWNMRSVAVTIAKQYRFEINAYIIALLIQEESVALPTLVGTSQTQAASNTNSFYATTSTMATSANNSANIDPCYSSAFLLQHLKFLDASLNHQLRYLDTGNSLEWQIFIKQAIQEFTALGMDYSCVTKGIRFSLQALWKFFQQKLPALGTTFEDLTADEYLKNLRQKLDYLDLVGTTTAGMALGLGYLYT